MFGKLVCCLFFFLGLCKIIFTIYKCVFMYLNTLNKIAIIYRVLDIIMVQLLWVLFLRVSFLRNRNSANCLFWCVPEENTPTTNETYRTMLYNAPNNSQMYGRVMLSVWKWNSESSSGRLTFRQIHYWGSFWRYISHSQSSP